MQRWKTLERRTLLNHSKFLRVENHTLELPDGCVIDNWPWVITPEYIDVVAITAEGLFMFARHIKYALGQVVLAPIGGYIEPGEAPLQAAKRELLEETGYEAAEWQTLGSYVIDANRGVGVGHLFLAQGARQVAEPNSDDLEEQQLVLLKRSEVEKALFAGEFKVLPWAATIALALLQLGASSESHG